MSGYCAHCRARFGDYDNPPYAVIHQGDDPPVHLHPLTREVVQPVREEGM